MLFKINQDLVRRADLCANDQVRCCRHRCQRDERTAESLELERVKKAERLEPQPITAMLSDVVRCGEVSIHIARLGESESFVLGRRDVVLHEVLVAKGACHSLDHVVACGDRERGASKREFVADDQLGKGCDDS